ncbi:MAG: penicillin-binding protein 2 [Rhodobacteraceae bacterium]|nr:penicillin-binding protein 2 [Paracoccaceae bacterium]
MTRTPLRPLPRILEARRKGENPDAIERENLAQRHEELRDGHRMRAEGRLLVLGVFFFVAFSVVGARMGLMAASEAHEPRAQAAGAAIVATRADIVDRNGRVLATNLSTNSLYAQPLQMVDPVRSAHALVEVFPDLNAEKLIKQFTGGRKFLWIKKKISPEQQQAVFDIGEPGLLFGPREMRLYPNGRLAAHILGGASFGREGVHSAEVIGVAGVEKAMDATLRDPAREGAPVQLSIDVTVQSAIRQVLYGGMKLMNAKGATAVLMEVNSGEVISMVSLPDFDPNARPDLPTTGDAGDSPLFNRAVQGVYELGSVFKIFNMAMALQDGQVTPTSMVDTTGPMRWGRYRIRDFHNYGPHLSATDVIVKSSNVGSARLALEAGADRQQEFLGDLGFFTPTPVELVEAPYAKPLLPKNWSDIVVMTASYGHGFSSSPLHLATGYASLLNGGTKVTPTLLKRDGPAPVGPRIVRPEVSEAARAMLRQVVVRGTARFGEVSGYAVGGKTGTADKPKPKGGYYKDRVVATFASVFPAHDPKYVLIVSLDEPSENSGPKPRRTAGWTAVPVAAEVIRRVAPLLGLRPEIEPVAVDRLLLSSN